MSTALRSYLLTDLSPPEIEECRERDNRLIVPVGACDQYGPHLPLGAGTRVAEALATDLSREFGVLLAPTIPFGVNQPGSEACAGTAGLREKTLHRLLNDLLAEWENSGFAEFVLLSAQRHDPHIEALAAVTVASARVRVVEALAIDLREFLDGPRGPEHGGEILTSLLLHLQPELVHMERARDYPLDPERFRRGITGRIPDLPIECNGAVGSPTLASAEKGRGIYAHILEKIRDKVFIAPPAG